MQKEPSTVVRNALDRTRRLFSIREMYLRELRGRWGRHLDVYRDRSDIAALHVLTRSEEAARAVDDTTWHDLDMNALFDRLDGNTTPLGRQYLYRQLRTYEPDERVLEERYRTAQRLRANGPLREEVQLRLWLLKSSNASAVTVMLFGELPRGDFPRFPALCLALLSSVSIAVAILWPALFWLPLAPVLANFLFAEAYAHRIGRHSVSFVYLRHLLTVARRLSAIDTDEDIEPLRRLRERRGEIRRLRARFRIVGLDVTSENVVTAQIAYVLNLVCLFDFLVFMRCHRRLLEHRETLADICLTVASLDSAIAVGSYLEMNAEHCNPRFGGGQDMRFEAVTHPLLEGAVANDYGDAGDSALITGSNMAGKSTFIKAIGLNLVLAQTVWLCHARAATLPKSPVMSSIKRADSLAEGKSYYFAEIESLLRLIVASEERRHHVFLIDEILHGTNTVERIASAAAVLERISRGDTVLVTTHDVELGELLPARFRAFHFSETDDPENLFDYTLREGHGATRNAIALLAAVGFPPDVIEVARRIAAESERR